METKSKIRLFVLLTVATVAVGLALHSCKEDESLSQITGTVTYAEDLPADGAIVKISSDALGTIEINTVVANASGQYLITGLKNGTYYLSARYNTENVNNLKSAGYNFATSSPVEVSVSGNIVQDLALANATGGTDIINTYDGTWTFDKVHSGVNWSTAYQGDNADLTGKFTSFKVDIAFDESNPEATVIEAWVQLSSANTGEPGRDDLGHCLNGYLGVETDTMADGTYFVSDPNTDTAFFNSTGVKVYGDGYLSSGSLTFRGITKSIDLLFLYTGQADYSADGDGTGIRGGFSGEFKFNAITDFLVTSTSIADLINVKVNANYRKSN